MYILDLIIIRRFLESVWKIRGVVVTIASDIFSVIVLSYFYQGLKDIGSSTIFIVYSVYYILVSGIYRIDNIALF